MREIVIKVFLFYVEQQRNSKSFVIRFLIIEITQCIWVQYGLKNVF
jgi:hypothetical protein